MGLHGLHAEFSDPVVQLSPLLRRMKAALYQWSVHPGLQDTDVVLQQLAASDDEAVHAGYSLARTFIWALPVLGLVGTVIGIAGAVGGFAKFLGGSIDDITIIKQNLVNVTGGLSFAFLITLEGLLTSLILMLAASALQTRERELYARVQKEVADQLVPALQRVAPEAYKAQAKQTSDFSGLRDILAEQGAKNAAQMAAFTEGLLHAISERHTQWMTQLSTVGSGILTTTKEADAKMWQNTQDQMEKVVATVSAGMERAASAVGDGVSRNNDQFLEKFRIVVQEYSAQQSAAAAAVVARQQEEERSAARHHALLQKLSENAETTRGAAEAVVSLTETTQRVLQFQQDLRNALSDLDAGPTRAAFDGFSQALRTGSAEMGKVMQSADNLGQLTHQIVSSQATLQQATRQLADARFGDTMNDLQQSLARLAPVLASFQRPFVFQAVPFAKDAASE